MTYDARDEDTVRETPVDFLETAFDNPALDDEDMLGAIVTATARTIAQQQEQSLESVARQAFLDTATGEELTRRARELGVERRDAVKATGVLEFTRESPAPSNIVVAEGTTAQTVDGDVTFETTESTTIDGPTTETDSTTYTEGGTSFKAKTTHDIDVSYRDSITVSGEIKTDNGSHAASLKIVDTTNSSTALNTSTTNTSFATQSSSYDVSSLTGTITIEYRLKVADSSAKASLTNAEVDADGQKGTKANARATAGGTDGNLPADRLVTLTSGPAGVESVTNPNPTGDDNFTDTNGDTLVPGLDRETDAELRERTFDSTSIGGAATPNAIETAVLDIDGVKSVTIFANPTDTTDANGLPPYSNEVIVSGGNDTDIAEELVDIVSVTELYRLQSGVIGNGVTKSVFVDVLDESVDVDFSRPVEVNVDITITIDTLDSYVGDDELKDRIVEYVGGTRTDGSTKTGLGTGEDVYIDKVEDAIVGTDTGVRGIASATYDTNDDSSDDTTTNSDGITVLSIADSEQAFVDASNVTITEV